MITPAAMLMQTSATLKIGQCGSCRKSTTWPRKAPGDRKTRSVRLPSTPASRKPSPIAQPVLCSRRETQSTPTTAATATQVSTSVYDVPVLNAAPGLRAR